MTPTRVALMMGGCWVIPTFISFLPIMQGWNSIGIDHVVSLQDGKPGRRSRLLLAWTMRLPGVWFRSN